MSPYEGSLAPDEPGLLRQERPGWLSRLFAIETGTLQACDAHRTDGVWSRAESFRFLYRSSRAKYFLLTGPREWRTVTEAEAETLLAALPVKLVTRLEPGAAFEARPAGEDDRQYQVVRNDNWEYAINLVQRGAPSGWTPIGVQGAREACLDHIDQHCVFGAPPSAN